MEWKLTQIPKILHLYWGGGIMSYMRFMTIKTFIQHNPDWEVKFLYPKHHSKSKSWYSYENKDVTTCTDFLYNVKNLPITMVEVDFEDFGVTNELPEVHKSDFIRLYQLHKFGGLWSDMDIIYVKPMNDFYANNTVNHNIETFICNNEYGHSIGFMMGCEGNKFFGKLLELSKKEYDPIYYQTLGAKLYNKYFYTMDSINEITSAINIPMDIVYPIVAGNEEKILFGTDNQFTDRTLGLHWYAGHPQWKDFVINTNGGLINLPNTVIGDLLKL